MSEQQRALTSDDRADLRRRHVPMDIPGSEDDPWCRHCGLTWPCPTIRALGALERCEALMAYEQGPTLKRAEWDAVLAYLRPKDWDGPLLGWFQVIEGEIRAVTRRGVERARQVQP